MKERKLKKRGLKEDPAIVIAAFGTTTAGKKAYDMFDVLLKSEFSGYRVEWAYTSEIVREKTGVPGLWEALSRLEAQGYRKAIVQPLHIFPATEYRELAEDCKYFPAIRIAVGETLMHRWHFVDEVLEIASRDFLMADQGINIIAIHGTPLCDDPVNATYLAFERLLHYRYENVILYSVEGIPGKDGLEARLSEIGGKIPHAAKHVRIFPFMYVAGIHVIHDLLGADNSLSMKLNSLGYNTDYPEIVEGDERLPKVLGLYELVQRCFVDRIRRAQTLLTYY